MVNMKVGMHVFIVIYCYYDGPGFSIITVLLQTVTNEFTKCNGFKSILYYRSIVICAHVYTVYTNEGI